MNTTSSPSPSTALVLGGGGSSGNAWLLGVVAGLFDAGLDVTGADLTIGTSAGATAAAQFSGSSPSELFAATVDAPAPSAVRGATEPTDGAGGTGTARPPSAISHLERLRGIIAASADIVDMRRRIGASAIAAGAGSSGSSDVATARWRETVAARFPGHEWPAHRTVRLTAVDAESGEPVIFDRESGVELVDAVAASCAGGGFAYRIGDRRYLDGGYRSNPDNADLAAGYARVLVLSPLGRDSLFPAEWGQRLDRQVDALRAAGSRVETVVPRVGSEHLFGANAMNPALRPLAAGIGYEQGSRLAPALSDLWD